MTDTTGKRPKQAPKKSSSWALWVGLGILVVALGFLFYAQSQQGEDETVQAQRLVRYLQKQDQKYKDHTLPLDGPGQQFASLGNKHEDMATLAKETYNSNPPTSGPHAEVFPDNVINEQPLPIYIQVHMLEHGNILLQYNPTKATPADINALQKIANTYNKPYNLLMAQQVTENGAAVIVAPNSDMPETIAVTAWRRLQQFDHATGHEKEIQAFIDNWLTNYANLNNKQ